MLTNEQREKLMKLSSNTVSDAMNALGFEGATCGIRPLWEACAKLVGEAVTIKLGPTGEVGLQNSHLCVDAINSAKPGDVIVIDNHGDMETSSWGGLLANGAQAKGIAGVCVDGVARDLDYFMECGFPVYARGTAVRTSRGKVMEYETNGMIQFGNVQVRPGDVIVGDHSGISIIPQERLADVIAKAEELEANEAKMMQDVGAGANMFEVDKKYDYVHWLQQNKK
ncbi:RraA family protein [Murdochiella sp. Marseille-P8839]|nr:RraA family protein [Murdochiella sp. Marseille-P8839]